MSSQDQFSLGENPTRSRSSRRTCALPIALLLLVIFLTTSVVFGVLWGLKTSSSSSNKYAVDDGTIGFPPLLPNDGKYLQWTILHLNDVYEMLPLDQNRKGGLPRVAHVRQLLKQENPQTYTVLAGDFLSPSALSQAIVNGSALNGKQMIAAFNTLGLDFVTFGNHEFDLTQPELIARMSESTFKWISSNVFQSGTNESFSISIPYNVLSIEQVRILLIGLTIDIDKPYISIVNQSSLVSFVKQFLHSISDVKYDVLIALTHLDISTDILLVENIPEIDVIMGGHEHENYYYLRGSEMTPIYKSDGNDFTVYIHRFAFNLDTRRLRLYSTLAKINPEIENEEKTNAAVNYWFDLGMKGLEEMGYEPNKIVSCLPADVELDGRSTSVRNVQTLLTTLGCECMINSTSNRDTTIGLFNSGSIRIDDILRGTITQYDVLRILPYQNNLFALSVPGSILANVLINGANLKGNGMFISYSGVETTDGGKTWYINGTDVSKSGLRYNVATMSYARANVLNDTSVNVLQEYNITQTTSLIDYLTVIYPPC